MIGGIYYELSLGELFDKKRVVSIRTAMKELFNAYPEFFDGDNLTKSIDNYWYNRLKKNMNSILSKSKPGGKRDYYNRTVDLTRSFCMGTYYNGKLRQMYRFEGGKNEAPIQRRHSESPSARAEMFLRGHKTMTKYGHTIVFAVTMPYAVCLEKEYGKRVLIGFANALAKDITSFKSFKGQELYGYVFEPTGEYGI